MKLEFPYFKGIQLIKLTSYKTKKSIGAIDHKSLYVFVNLISPKHQSTPLHLLHFV